MTSIARELMLPAALLRPEAFPHHPAAVELRETHISWVFLAGENVYKVKKPVRFPFLDYSTPALRHEYCHAELDLNRRFAPDVYRGVVALVPEGDGLAIAPEHDPRAVDYAVAMRRYDESATLAARLDRGDVEEREVLTIGAAIAGWHAVAPVISEPDGLGEVVEETLTTLREAGAPAARLAGLARFSRAGLNGFGRELDARALAGRARDGHGDLRAEHILIAEHVTAVDGVEFDQALRATDVGYDLAFLVMDVARRDEALARALVRGYRAASGDPGTDGLLDFFCVVRALVRAKIDLLRADQLSGTAARERAARARELLGLAERFAWRARLPRIVCVTGLSASGKSTVAEALAAKTGWPVLSSDRVRKQRAGIGAFEPASQDVYGDDESRAVYQGLAQLAAAAVHHDGGVIVDATFRRAVDAEAFQTASVVMAEAEWLVCEAPPAVLLERAAARAGRGSVSDAGPAVVAAQIAAHQGPFEPRGRLLARLDTTRPLPELLEGLAAELDTRLATRSRLRSRREGQ
jgi:aminoglycoside phosphotransferase family enzyme/predicted kinase